MPDETGSKRQRCNRAARLRQIPCHSCLLPVGLGVEFTVRNGTLGEFKQDYPLFSESKAENHMTRFKDNELGSFLKLEGCCDLFLIF